MQGFEDGGALPGVVRYAAAVPRRRRDSIERKTPGHVEHRCEEGECEDERQPAARGAARARRRDARPRGLSSDTALDRSRTTPARCGLRGRRLLRGRARLPLARRADRSRQAPGADHDGRQGSHASVPSHASRERSERAASARGESDPGAEPAARAGGAVRRVDVLVRKRQDDRLDHDGPGRDLAGQASARLRRCKRGLLLGRGRPDGRRVAGHSRRGGAAPVSPPAAMATTTFACVTGPSLPGLESRMPTLTFTG